MPRAPLPTTIFLSVRYRRQSPTVNGGKFKLSFRTVPFATSTLSDVGAGGGVVIRGNYAYVLDRTGNGKLIVYDISNPASPNKVSDSITFIGEPRDLVLIPSWP